MLSDTYVSDGTNNEVVVFASLTTQIMNLEVAFSKLLYTFLHGFVVLTLASIPSLILNAPVGMAAKYWSFHEAQKDLKASRVKVSAALMSSFSVLINIASSVSLQSTPAV